MADSNNYNQNDPQKPILDLIESSCQKYDVEIPTHTSIGVKAKSVISPLIKKMSEKDFYQWFCPIWQSFEFLYFNCSSEDDWASLVGQLAMPLTEEAEEEGGYEHRSLRAMCVSFMMNSLNTHPLAQSYALRMLLNFAIKTHFYEDKTFVLWLINFMKNRIDNMISNYQSGVSKNTLKNQSQIFANVCIKFFDLIPFFDTNCALSILQLYGITDFVQIVQSKSQKGEEDEKKMHLVSIATKTFNTSLLDDTFFTFEIIRKTKLVYDNLNETQQKLLQIFVDGKIQDYEKFISENKSYVEEQKLDLDKMKDKILVLSFISLVHGKGKISFNEIKKELNLDNIRMKRLCVRINSTDVASLSIDSVNEVVIIDYCQPRLMTDDVWEDMAVRLRNLSKSLLYGAQH